jgi:hypothetical protein
MFANSDFELWEGPNYMCLSARAKAELSPVEVFRSGDSKGHSREKSSGSLRTTTDIR